MGAHTAYAQAALDPAALDVAGVKLGMTPDQAIAALKGFDSGFAITKRYLSSQEGSFNEEGTTLDQIPQSDKALAYLASLYAIKGATVHECRTFTPGSSAPPCVDRHPDDEEIVKVWFSHVLGQERVVMIQRAKTFYKEPKPAIPTLKQEVLAKYGNQITYDSSYGGFESISWLYDAQGRQMSGAVAKTKGFSNVGGIPSLVRRGDGIGLNVVFKGNNHTDQIADSLSVTLSDGDALYRSVDEAKTTYDTLKARANAAAVGNATKSQSQTKF
jgi:hypothetical protein